jgi:O-antigen/teichoic acid export membrane protein
MDLKQKTLAGLTWSLIGRFGQQVAQFIITVYLARLLSPREFGTVVMVLVITEFAMLFLVHGFPAALIQKQNLRPAHLYSIFWLNIFMGVTLSIALFLTAPLIAKLYQVSALDPIARVLAGSFFLSSLATIPRTLLQKDLAFKRLALVDTIAVIASGGIAIVLASLGFKVWSLVFQTLSLALFTTIGVWLVSSWRPKLVFELQAIKDLFRFSVNHLGTIIVYYWADNIEKMLVGRFLGSYSLGIYNRALNNVRLVTSQLDTILYQVMFPVFSTIQGEKHRVKQLYLDSISSISFITVPLMFGMLATAKPFILTVYGVKWAEVIPILQILCGIGLLAALITPAKWIYMSQGKTDWMLRLEIASSILLIVLKTAGAFTGNILLVALSFVVAYVLLIVPVNIMVGKLIDMKIREVIKAVQGVFGCGTVMALSLWFLDWLLPDSLAIGLQLFINVIVGAGIYWGLVHILKVPVYLKMKTLALEKINARFFKTQNNSQSTR